MNLSDRADKFVKSTLWLWLPFYALFELIQDLGERRKR